jgi:hypothetical protein
MYESEYWALCRAGRSRNEISLIEYLEIVCIVRIVVIRTIRSQFGIFNLEKGVQEYKISSISTI